MATPLAQDFRVTLRHLRAMPSFRAPTSPLRAFVLGQFKSGKAVQDEAQAASLRALAHSYATMVKDIKDLKHLRYLDSGEKLDPREKIRNTAARVGLSVPKFADEFEGGLRKAAK